jgi:aspartate/methionine/tyrosine aminotransferase
MLFGAYVNQKAAATALCSPRAWIAGAAEDFERARDFLFAGIHRIPGISCVKPAGGPFLFLNVARLGINGDEFSSLLLENFGVPTTPGSFLQSREHVRLAFGAEKPVLEAVLNRMQTAAQSLAH